MSDNAQDWHDKKVGALEATNKQLQKENADLRRQLLPLEMQRESLLHRLAKVESRNGSLHLPDPDTFNGNTYVFPIQVGETPMSISSIYSEQYQPPKRYRMYFHKEYARVGCFWRVEPFCT